MKLCVLSNSHAAALKTGHDQLGEEDRQALELSFFAARHHGLAHVEARDGVLQAALPEVEAELRFTSGGSGVLDPRDHDAFLIHALGLAYDYAQFDPVFRSRQYLRRVFSSSLSRSLALALFGKLRSVTEKPIYLSHQPYVSEADSRLRHKVEKSPHVGLPFADVMRPLMQQLEGPVHWIEQPEDTITHGHFTRQAFSEGSLRLAISASSQGKRHGGDDHVHMNANYGQAFWSAFLHRQGALEKTPGRPQVSLTPSGA